MRDLTLQEAKAHILIDPVSEDNETYNVYIKFKGVICKFAYRNYPVVQSAFGNCHFYNKTTAYNMIYKYFIKYIKKEVLNMG